MNTFIRQNTGSKDTQRHIYIYITLSQDSIIFKSTPDTLYLALCLNKTRQMIFHLSGLSTSAVSTEVGLTVHGLKAACLHVGQLSLASLR